jgi:hypothetical protein
VEDDEDSDEFGFCEDAGVEPLVWGQDILYKENKE